MKEMIDVQSEGGNRKRPSWIRFERSLLNRWFGLGVRCSPLVAEEFRLWRNAAR